MYDEIAKLHRQGRALRNATLYGATVIAFAAAALWFGFDTGEHHQARADMRQLAAWVTDADYPTVQLSYPGKLPVAEIKDGYCTPYPHKLPKFYHVEYVSPEYVPCASQHYVKPTAVSPALAAIIKHTEGKS